MKGVDNSVLEAAPLVRFKSGDFNQKVVSHVGVVCT